MLKGTDWIGRLKPGDVVVYGPSYTDLSFEMSVGEYRILKVRTTDHRSNDGLPVSLLDPKTKKWGWAMTMELRPIEEATPEMWKKYAVWSMLE